MHWSRAIKEGAQSSRLLNGSANAAGDGDAPAAFLQCNELIIEILVPSFLLPLGMPSKKILADRVSDRFCTAPASLRHFAKASGQLISDFLQWRKTILFLLRSVFTWEQTCVERNTHCLLVDIGHQCSPNGRKEDAFLSGGNITHASVGAFEDRPYQENVILSQIDDMDLHDKDMISM